MKGEVMGAARNGFRAFTARERRTFDALRAEGMNKRECAAVMGVSMARVYALTRRGLRKEG